MKLLTLKHLPLLLILVSPAWAQKFSGQLLEKGSRQPLAGINVFVLPHKLKAMTDDQGHFELPQIPEGSFTWVVNAAGYRKLEESDESKTSNSENVHDLYLEKLNYQVFETTVFGKQKKRDDTSREMKASQFLNVPGAGGDPLKAIQNLPGVNRPAAFQSQVIIQGSAPKDTRYTIDGHEVPLIFHLGGLSSVVLPEAIDRVDYLSAGYGPANGRAIGGLVGLWTRSPRTDRIHGMAYADLLNAGGFIEGPIGKKSSFLLGVRQSYVGALLKAAFAGNADFNLTVAPTFGDIVGLYQTEITPIDEFKLTAVGSSDKLEFLFSQPVNQDPSIRGDFGTKTSFFRLIPQWIHHHSSRTTSRWSLGLGKDWIQFTIGDNYFKLDTYSMTVRGEIEKKFSPLWTSTLGMDHRYSWASIDLSARSFYTEGGVANPFSVGETRTTSVNAKAVAIGLFWKNELSPGADSAWVFQPNLRSEYYRTTREFFLLPRGAIRYQMSESLSLRTSGGLYVQPPEEQEANAPSGNVNLKSPRAWHLSLGAEKDLRDGGSRGWIVSGGGFYRYFDQLVSPSTQFITGADGRLTPENYNNAGRGHAFGLETLLKMEFAPWTGWLSYTLARSTRWKDQGTENLFAYDQTHLLSAIGAVELGNHWRIGLRIRYVTGNPVTPVTSGIFDADNDVYIPVRGAIYSERLGPFFQTDLRIDKKWIFDRWILSAYLDIQNVTNRRNIEQVSYSYDYRTKMGVAGLPILPTLGLKAEF